MITFENSVGWQVIGTSVRGASHERADMPNQDAIAWRVGDGSLPLLLALADGHGGAKYFRSERGAAFAVSTALDTLDEFLAQHPDNATLSTLKHTAEEWLPKSLVRSWHETVIVDHHANPYTEQEWDTLTQRDGIEARRVVEADPTIGYGATLLAVLVTDKYLLYLQLGDGDILAISEAGEVTRPLPADPYLFGTETTSLCQSNAWQHVRVGFHVLAGMPPALILLATDGYANSFREDTGFLKVGSDLLAILRHDGPTVVSAGLPSWLESASREGSGDDVTVGLAFPSNLGLRNQFSGTDDYQDFSLIVSEQE